MRISCWAMGAAWWIAAHRPVAVEPMSRDRPLPLHTRCRPKPTQMTPQARGNAGAIFFAVIYLAQTAGVRSGSRWFSTAWDAVVWPLFVATRSNLPALAWCRSQARSDGGRQITAD